MIIYKLSIRVKVLTQTLCTLFNPVCLSHFPDFEPSSGSVARINIKKGTSFNNFSTFFGSQSCPNKETKEIPTGKVAWCILYAYKNAHL